MVLTSIKKLTDKTERPNHPETNKGDKAGQRRRTWILSCCGLLPMPKSDEVLMDFFFFEVSAHGFLVP